MLNPAAGLSKDGAGASDWALSPSSAPPAKRRRLLLLGGVALVTVAGAAGVALGVLRPWQSPAGAPAYAPSADTLAVRAHVAAQISMCLRPPQGNLTFPYLIPAGGYDQLWVRWTAVRAISTQIDARVQLPVRATRPAMTQLLRPPQ